MEQGNGGETMRTGIPAMSIFAEGNFQIKDFGITGSQKIHELVSLLSVYNQLLQEKPITFGNRAFTTLNDSKHLTTFFLGG